MAEAERQQARAVDRGHGRLEVRELVSTTMLEGYLDWPDVRQVFELRRWRKEKGEATQEVAWGITSLSRGAADAEDLLALVRGHWGMENGLHYARDVTLKEDACRARKGNSGQVLAALRNVAVHLLKEVPAVSNAAATRRFARHSNEALHLLLSSWPLTSNSPGPFGVPS